MFAHETIRSYIKLSSEAFYALLLPPIKLQLSTFQNAYGLSDHIKSIRALTLPAECTVSSIDYFRCI